MKHLIGFGLAGLLGIFAAALNWIWLSGLATPEQFVGVDSEIEAGEEISEEQLVAVPIPGDFQDLQKSFIPWRDRAIVFGNQANRTYVAGDVLLHRDIETPAESSQWEVIGPFKLISVGERFKERSVNETDDPGTDGNNLTIAVDANFSANTRKLLDVIRPDRLTDDPTASNIVAVQVLPSNNSQAIATPPEPENVVYQTVSLEGIANVPRVLLEGDMIRFVIPGRPRY